MIKFINFYFGLFVSFLMINSQIVYSQTEYDYYEKLRLERKEKRIKLIKTDKDVIDYYDEQGYHFKREYYFEGNMSSYSLINQQSNGYLSVKMDLGPEGIFTTTGSQALYYITYFDPYNLIDNVVMVFDSKGRVSEERITGTDMEGAESIKYFYKNEEIKPYRSEYYSDNKLLSKTDYYYDDSGLFIKVVSIWINNNEQTITNYSYEYY